MTNINANASIANTYSSPEYVENSRSAQNKKKDQANNDQNNDLSNNANASTNNAGSTIVSISSSNIESTPIKNISETRNDHAAYSSFSLKINASPQKIWAALTDIDHWKEWVPGVSSSTLEGTLKPGSHFEWRSNGFAINSQIDKVVDPYKITWNGDAFGTKAHHEWTLIPEGGGVTTVTTSESFDGWLPSLFSGSMQSTLDDSLPQWLNALKKKVE